MKRFKLMQLGILFPFLCTAREALPSAAALSFKENKGQVTDQFYHSRTDIQFGLNAGNGLNIFIGNAALHYQFTDAAAYTSADAISPNKDKSADRPPVSMYRMDIELLGANSKAPVVAEQMQEYYENYYTPGTGPDGAVVHSFNKITYKDIYPGIDWVLYISNGKMKHQFVLRPGARAADIRLRYSGATSLKLLPSGMLQAVTPQGIITEEAPYSYDEKAAKVASSFVLNGNTLSYQLDSYTGTLVIDPTVTWSTYYGGNGSDDPFFLAKDPTGNLLFSGLTASTNNIASVGAHQVVFGGGNLDAYLVKFTSADTRVWATYYGGTADEMGNGVAADASGNVYLVGNTQSTTGIATAGAHQVSLGGPGWDDAFLVKFNSAGTRLWGTYYGGADPEEGNAVTVDGSDNVYLAGTAVSTSGIATAGSHQAAFAGGANDAFLVKFNASGVRQWGTYYGGAGADHGFILAHDASNNVILCGHTTSATGVSTGGSYQSALGGGTDVYLAKFNSSGVRQWGSYYGGAADEFVNMGGLAIGTSGEIYFTGNTYSTNNIASPGAYQAAFGGGTYDAFFAGISSAGDTRFWGTYFGGAGADNGYSATSDGNGNVIFAGSTTSTTGIATAGAIQPAFGGGTNDGFVAAFNTAGVMQWATYYGGAAYDIIVGLTNDGANNLYLLGSTGSASGIATAGAYQTALNGFDDAFLTKICYPGGAGVLTGPSSVCVSSNITLSSPVASGTWSASNTHATVAGGLVTGVSPGLDTITYSVTYPCGISTSTIVVSVDPFAGTLTGSDSVCAGLTINLASTVAGGTWSVTNFRAAVSASGVVTGLFAGMDTVKYTVSTSCGPAVATKVIVINPLPGPTIVVAGNTLSTTVSYNSYQWLLAGNPIPGATNPTYTATANGAYSVSVYNEHGCTATSAVTTLTHVAVTTLSPEERYIKVYPNPVHDILQIDYSNVENGSIELLNMLGEILLKGDLHSSIDVKVLPSGLYFYRICSTHGVLQQGKFIKQ